MSTYLGLKDLDYEIGPFFKRTIFALIRNVYQVDFNHLQNVNDSANKSISLLNSLYFSLIIPPFLYFSSLTFFHTILG